MNMRFSDYAIAVSPWAVAVLLFYIAIAATSVVAIIRIIQRAGFSGWWVLVVFVPFVNMIALWRFGFGSWPAFAKHAGSQP
jgi:uncharacterized membrane protein YhaH (DUF805 family)